FLHAQTHLLAQFSYQVGVFAVGFYHASPALIARYIEYRRVNIRVTQCFSFTADYVARLANKSLIPRTANPDRGGQRSGTIVFKAVYTLIRKINRATH